MSQNPAPTYRRNYRPPALRVEAIELWFELDPESTIVRSRLQFARVAPGALELDGRGFELVEIRLDGRVLATDEYAKGTTSLTLPAPPEQGVLEITTRLNPGANTALEGLYQSGAMLCTQCEAHGFSRITYYPDRPDVMTRFRVTLSAERKRFPVLLANGNLVAKGEGAGGHHWVTWEDPFPKPCYLFALVAGDLALIEDGFVTCSGRTVALHIYVEPENRDRCSHAMASLKQAMRWDEEAYGREYDLDLFMIVAVDSFNMGAMENKGLNIFNAKYILVEPATATDADHQAVRDIIGHEYFHNWTGNRITCRDWFQLSVKESLTVFREQQFSAAMGSPGVARVREARLIRTQQFPEDAGPTAHPVQPESYLEVNNLYTLTVYEKGAEVIRMLHTMLGPDLFRRGMDLYFERHDGEAVTVEQFLRAMEDASGRDLAQFRRWYHQAGTPVVKVREDYEPRGRMLRVSLEQGSEIPGSDPLHIPLRLALLEPSGAVRVESVVELTAPRQELRFNDVERGATLSVLRGFSAPVRVEHDIGDTRLVHILNHGGDAFACWDAAQQLFLRTLMAGLAACRRDSVFSPPTGLLEVLRNLLENPGSDLAMTGEMLTLPSESYFADQCSPLNVDAVIATRDSLRRDLASALYGGLLALYRRCSTSEPYRFDAVSAGRRRLRAVCLGWLTASDTPESVELATQQYRTADNMTDAFAALAALNELAIPARDECANHFRHRWEGNALVLDKWFGLQAARPDASAGSVRKLLADPRYDARNPNRIRALLGSFAHGNMRGFHQMKGDGYALIAEQVEALDSLNPQVAARLVAAFRDWSRFAEPRRTLQQERLRRLHAIPGLSPDVHEIVSKSLGIG